MFYKTGIDITNDKQMFNFLKNHFEYHVGNSYSDLSIANNVKLYNLKLSGDWNVAYELLSEGEYDTVAYIINKWTKEHSGFDVHFSGRSGGYLVLCNSDNYYPVLPDIITYTTDYEEYKTYCRSYYGSMRAVHDDLVYYTKLVQSFDKLCDELRDFCDELSNSDLESLIQLDIKYLKALHSNISNISAPNQTEREKARMEFFGGKILNLCTLWNKEGSYIQVDKEKFDSLVNGKLSFDISSYEDIFKQSKNELKKIEIKGVVKMIDLKDYQRIMENIGVRQMIFQGPPGTSKTYDAKKFVLNQLDIKSKERHDNYFNQESITKALESFKLNETDYSDPVNSKKLQTGGWDLVQFHPSYGYEDFIRGIEVEANGGMPSYRSVNKILGKISEFAKIAEENNPSNPPKFYLIIDEINRANVASVFGELIYGLEYRDSKVSTPYEVEDRTISSNKKSKDIVLGKNLFIVGTMNTADKSIDSIDYAIRRRFIFIDSPADRNTVINCYQNISGNKDENSLELFFFDAVQAIFDNDLYFNDEYQKNDIRLGHTYFLRKRKEGYEEDFINRFVFQIIPILREYVKDGILNSVENSNLIEHSSSEILNAINYEERTSMLSENILLYVNEFGNKNRISKCIDNIYIGNFIEELCTSLGY